MKDQGKSACGHSGFHCESRVLVVAAILKMHVPRDDWNELVPWVLRPLGIIYEVADHGWLESSTRMTKQHNVPTNL